MELQWPFRVITPTVDGAVLKVLAGADASFTAPTVQRLAGAYSVDGIRKALRRLAEQGIVDRQHVGNTVAYSLNREHLAAPAIIEIASMRNTLIDRTAEVMEQWSIRPIAAALFGSAARGEMHPDSDIDLFLVAPDGRDEDAWTAQVGDLSSTMRHWTGNDTQPFEMTESDLHKAIHSSEPVISVIAAEGIWIVGDRSVLGSDASVG